MTTYEDLTLKAREICDQSWASLTADERIGWVEQARELLATPALSGEAHRFLEVRPWYDLEHLRIIERNAWHEQRPFCDDCADWHGPDEGHGE